MEEYTKDVPDWLGAPSPPAVIARTWQGEELDETPPTRLNR